MYSRDVLGPDSRRTIQTLYIGVSHRLVRVVIWLVHVQDNDCSALAPRGASARVRGPNNSTGLRQGLRRQYIERHPHSHSLGLVLLGAFTARRKAQSQADCRSGTGTLPPRGK